VSRPMPAFDRFDIAQHEAAHVVVGVSLGLRLYEAALTLRPGETWGGHCWFPRGHNEALAIMYAAGIAWERALRNGRSPIDAKLCRALVSSRHAVQTCVRAAGAIIATSSAIHTRVTRALLDQNLRGRDVEAIARGERPGVDDL
jgi:hypothetical protein